MIATPACYRRRCRHFRGVEQPDGTERTERAVCAAFPSGIPEAIASGADPHAAPLPGQGNEVVFEGPEAA